MTSLNLSARIRIIIAVLVAFTVIVVATTGPVAAVGFNVDSTADEVDTIPGNGTCASANNNCTLRAAIQEANAFAGADTINVPAGTYSLSLTGAPRLHAPFRNGYHIPRCRRHFPRRPVPLPAQTHPDSDTVSIQAHSAVSDRQPSLRL